jgi:hypothetical protein
MPIRLRNIPGDRQPVSHEPNARADTDWYGYWQDLGRGIRELQAGPVATSYTVATLPTTATAGAMIYVSNESGGAVPAFWDGTNWRRMTDRAIVS